MEIYEVGKVVEKFKGAPEGSIFDFSDTGMNLVILFNNPSAQEIKQFKAENPFEVRFMEMSGILMFTFKIGNLNWIDASYSPVFSKHLSNIEKIETIGKGYSLTVYLINATTGMLKHMRQLGLSTQFSLHLRQAVLKLLTKDISKEAYIQAVKKNYAYSSEQISNLSKECCKIGGQK